MNYFRTAIIISLLVLTSDAEAFDFQVLPSKPSGDLILEVFLHKSPGTNYAIAESIGYGFATVTNMNCPVLLPTEAYLCSAQMIDPAGNSVKLNGRYSGIGGRFFELKYPSAEQPWSRELSNVMSMKPAHSTGPGNPVVEADFVIATQDAAVHRWLPSVKDLFDAREPGIYKVTLRFQVYARIYKGGHSLAYKLERFEPIEFTVAKDKKE